MNTNTYNFFSPTLGPNAIGQQSVLISIIIYCAPTPRLASARA